MKAEFLGDANDHLKGSLHTILRSSGAVRELHAIPMATDEWSAAHKAVYVRLLGLSGPDRVVPGTQFLGSPAHRRAYFQEAIGSIPPGADALVDPDTGIRERDAGSAHVLVDELRLLIEADPDRVLVVYDESRDRRIPKLRHVQILAAAIARSLGPAVAYEAGRSLTMFITGRALARIVRVHELLGDFLGPAKERRLHFFAR